MKPTRSYLRPRLLDYEAKPDIVATEATVFEEYREWNSSRTGAQNYQGFPSTMSVQSLSFSRTRSMSRSAKRLRMWGTCTSHDQTWRVLTACMRVQRITPSTGVIARVHTCILGSSGLALILSSNLLHPYTDHPMDIMMRMTRPSSSSSESKNSLCETIHTDVFACFQIRFSFPHDICCSSAFKGTRIFQQHNFRDTQKVPLIIKEVYVPESGRPHGEAEMLKYLHSNDRKDQEGPLWGCLRAIEPEGRLIVRTPEWADEEARVKRRLLCSDTGKIISRSNSVLQFLEATFDSLERERFLAGYVTYLAVLTKNSSSPRCI